LSDELIPRDERFQIDANSAINESTLTDETAAGKYTIADREH
jgi:hypothetical protein